MGELSLNRSLAHCKSHQTRVVERERGQIHPHVGSTSSLFLMTVSQSVSLSVCLSVCPSVCVCLSVCLSVYLSVCLSVCPLTVYLYLSYFFVCLLVAVSSSVCKRFHKFNMSSQINIFINVSRFICATGKKLTLYCLRINFYILTHINQPFAFV